MHVLLVGGGGREHALAWKLLQSPRLSRLSTTHDNPGFPRGSHQPGAAEDPEAFAVAEGVDLVVVGPEAPLADGLIDRLQAAGVAAVGPTKAAAQLEASKAFAKEVMERSGVPTAAWSVHTDLSSALAAIDGPCVVKADGLAAGKGVVVADSAEEAKEAVREVLGGRFGQAGARVLIEERLTGPEVSVLALCDGERAVPLQSARDHKRRFAGDQGPNTGGMGALCPAPGVPPETIESIRRTVLQPVVDTMAASGTPFRGVLYAGLMLTPRGPKVLEFNARFGDPECQPLMMMLDEDLLPLLHSAATASLPDRPLRWKSGACCCVVVVSDGYPGSYEKGHEISGLPDPSPGEVAFLAGARHRKGGGVETSGGRVLGLTCHGETLAQARDRAYALTETVSFLGAQWRSDIGAQPS